MVVGQGLSIPLDLENWWLRATAKGIVLSIELVAQGFGPPTNSADVVGTLQLLHHPTGRMETRTTDWIVLAVPANPTESLYLDLRAAGAVVSRVGDC